MPTAQHAHRRARSGHAWWRPAAYSAAAAAAVAALFNPLPALADPAIGQGGVPGSVPDVGSRPIPAGALVLPGQSSATTTTPITTPALSGSTNPVLQKIQKGRDRIATLGDQLIEIGQNRDGAKTQLTSSQDQATQAENDLRNAESSYSTAATQDVLEAAAMPPGALDSGLVGLDDLAHLQRGEQTSTQTAVSQLEQAQIAAQIALDLQSQAQERWSKLDASYTKLNTEITKLQAAQQKLENANRDLLNAAEASQAATDSQLGSQILAGSEAGRGADPRAVEALQFALSQRGKPYVWSTEGPNTYDCSGLMYRAYHNVGFPLVRVSRDQYWQTRNKVVDRYSLLPGDLLFFSYTNSWTGIHHVAMYAGDGMMVEAPRTGLNVRLVPVRWTELFQATRVFGSVEGGEQAPDLGSPDPQPTETTPAHTGKPTTKPPTTKPTTKPPTTKPTKPSGTPTTKPPTSPSGTPTTKPPTSPSGTPTTKPPTSPTDSPKPTDPSPTTNPPAGGTSTSPSSSSGGSTSPSTTGATKSSESASKSASASSSAGTK